MTPDVCRISTKVHKVFPEVHGILPEVDRVPQRCTGYSHDNIQIMCR